MARIPIVVFLACVLFRESLAAVVPAADADAAGILDKIATTVTTPEPETTTACIYDTEDCPGGFEKHSDRCECICRFSSIPNEPTKYLLPWGASHIAQYCAPGTLWNEKICGCDWPANIKTSVETNVAAPTGQPSCISIVNYAFNPSLGKYTDRNGANHVGEVDKHGSEMKEVNGSISTKTAYFKRTSIAIAYLQGNDLTANAYLEARIKPFDTKENITQVIFSNGCEGYKTNRDKQPSILLAHNAAERKFTVSIRTKIDGNGECKDIKADQNGWYKVSIAVAKSNTTVLVNDQPCAKITGKQAIATTECALTIGGDPTRKDHILDFNGYIDYVKIQKHCSKPDTPQ